MTRTRGATQLELLDFRDGHGENESDPIDLLDSDLDVPKPVIKTESATTASHTSKKAHRSPEAKRDMLALIGNVLGALKKQKIQPVFLEKSPTKTVKASEKEASEEIVDSLEEEYASTLSSSGSPDIVDSRLPSATPKRTKGGTALINKKTKIAELVEQDQERSSAAEVIEIASDSDSELLTSAPKSKSLSGRSQIRLLANPSYDLSDLSSQEEVNVDTVTVYELVGTKDLVETYQINFSVDLEYFLTFLHPDFSILKRPITFVTGSPHLASHPLKRQFQSKFNISEIVASLPNRFASHHSKAMVNFHADNTVEVVIMTCNLTQLDFGGLTQACWRSGKLKKGKTKSTMGSNFQRDFTDYLRKYGSHEINSVARRLEDYNFSAVSVELVASAPGLYKVDDILLTSEIYGYGKFRQVLERNGLLIETENNKIVAQVTSIASPYRTEKGKTASVFSHLLCPLMFSKWKKMLPPGGDLFKTHQQEFGYTPYLILPTSTEIAQSNFGYLSGSSVHFKYASGAAENQYKQTIQPYLCRWGTTDNITGREKVTPHVKYYACDNGDNWKTLKWVLIGSHNLSKQAWGYPLAKLGGTAYDVASYELSILIPQTKKPLVPVYNKDTASSSKVQPVRFPFQLPPTPYLSSDQPWSPGMDCGTQKDRWGNEHHGLFML